MQLLKQIQRITLWLFFFSINFEMMALNPGSSQTISMSKLTAFFYILSILPEYKLFFRIDHIKQYIGPIFLFFGWLTLISLININEISSEFIDNTILINILFFWIMINHERSDYLILEKAMLSFAFGALALALFFVAGIGVEYEGDRLSIFGDDQNYIGFRTSVAILILVLAVVQNRLNMGWWRYLLMIPIPLMLKLISETGSRGAFLSFVLTGITGILLFRTKETWKKVVAVIAGLIIFVVVGNVLLESNIMKERLLETVESGDTGGRTKIWHNLFEIVKNHPLTGIGKTGYIYETTLIYGQEESPHNVILEIMCYTGIIGLIMYLIFLYQIGINSYNIYRRTAFLLPILLLIPILGMILSIQILAKKFGWILFTYIVSATAMPNNTPNINENRNNENISGNTAIK